LSSEISYIKPPLFTVIVHTYYRPELLRESTDAILNQTYDNLEIILIDDGSTEETKKQLYEYQKKDKRVKLLHFEVNQFRWDDPHRIIDVCFNDALEMSTGDYIWHQDDDDMLAEDYIEKMVALFQGHPDCISAAGLPVNMDINGNIRKDEIFERVSNCRPRYMPGRIIALQHLGGNRTIFKAPGQIFSFERKALLKHGGFHKAYEHHQLYGIVPFGITGFDETAYFYWRRHEGQLNKKLSSQGWIGTKEIFSMVEDLNIEDKWRVFGVNTAKYVVTQIERNQTRTAAFWFVRNLFNFRLKGSLSIFRDIWYKPHFWLFIPGIILRRMHIISKIKSMIKSMIKFMIKSMMNTIDKKFPRLKKRSVLFNKIFLKVNR
tara:strand:- start:922 stop:2049 length:1128 start_codon:yes stop_codon:yes gene_type:complete